MTDLELAKRTLLTNSHMFVIVKDGVILSTGSQEGIGELIQAVDRLDQAVRGASLADKIAGKAVAMVVRAAGISAVFAVLASAAAREALVLDQIPLECERVVPLILNKRSDGPCPMERLTQPIAEPSAAVAALREFVRSRPPRPEQATGV